MKKFIKKINKYKYKILGCLGIVGLTMCMFLSSASAYTKSYEGKNNFDTSGGFYFVIKGGPSGNSKIHFIFNRKSGATSFANMMDKTSTWKVSMGSSTNNHNIKIVDTTISTKLDVTDSYNILSFRITYDMPTHYQYSTVVDDSPSGMRFNMNQYSYSGDGTNTASQTGGHNTSTTKRTVNIQVNTGNVGLRTFDKYWYYNCTLGFNIAKANRTVTFTNGLGTTLKSQTVSDGNGATAPSNPTRTGYTFAGWDKSYSLICSNTTVNAKWNINSYTNTIAHWAGGYKYGEGNNGAKNMKNIGNNSFAAIYGSSFNLGSSRATTIPRGFYLANYIGSSSISGSWGSYSMGINTKQQAYNMHFEYYYQPYNYLIKYNLNGGNLSGQSESYTVLYPESIPNPTRVGHKFIGWTGSNGSNPERNIIIPAGTIGNKTYTANWENNAPIINGPNLDNCDSNVIEPFLDNGKLVVQLGDTFTPNKYINAKDSEDGNLMSSLKISNGVPMNGNKTAQSGEYLVVYSVTDSGGKTATFKLTVIVNAPPEIKARNRSFFLNQYQVDEAELLRRVTANDKEDGDVTRKLRILSLEYLSDGKVETNFDYLDTSHIDIVRIQYEVTDTYKKSVIQTASMTIISNPSVEMNKIGGNIRFISDKYIFSLNNTSIWKTNPSLNHALKTSVESNIPKKTYKFSKAEIRDMKDYLNNINYKKGQETNYDFSNQFIK